MKHTCPVCGYDGLEYPPADYSICPSCGTEFGYHDLTFTPAQLRQRWIASGASWQASYLPPPPHWSAETQLRNIGYSLTEADRAALTRVHAA